MSSQWSLINPGRQFSIWMHLGGFVPTAYFTFHHLFQGIFWFGLSMIPGCTALLISSIYLFREKLDQSHRIFDRWFLILVLIPILVALAHPGLRGEYFVMPLVLICFTNLPLKLAQPLMFAFTTLSISLGFYSLGSHDGLRLAIGLIAAHCFAWGTAITLAKQHKDLRNLAFKDSLTNTYNRRALFDELYKAKQLQHRQKSHSAIILLDVDLFKSINDRFGHGVGDQVLMWFADILNQHTRENDRVYRYGGEEFLILCANTDFDKAFKVSEKLRAHFSQVIGPEQLKLSFSAGCAQIRASESIDDWIARADRGLYQAKASGRDQTWPEEMKT